MHAVAAPVVEHRSHLRNATASRYVRGTGICSARSTTRATSVAELALAFRRAADCPSKPLAPPGVRVLTVHSAGILEQPIVSTDSSPLCLSPEGEDLNRPRVRLNFRFVDNGLRRVSCTVLARACFVHFTCALVRDRQRITVRVEKMVARVVPRTSAWKILCPVSVFDRKRTTSVSRKVLV